VNFSEKQRKAIGYASKHGECKFSHIAEHAGINVSTLTRWRQNSSEFAEALEQARNGQSALSDAPVSIEEFVRNRAYLGLGVRGLDDGGTVFPMVLEELGIINSGELNAIILTGGIGCGKTFTAAISMLYGLYKLLLHDDPHQAVGMDKNAPIIFACQNRSKKLAERNTFALVRSMIMRSAWFQLNAPWHERLTSRVKFMNQNVEIWPASGDATDLLGVNVFSAIIDEANYFAITERSKRATDGGTYDGAREAFEGILGRKLSRFDDDQGMIFVVSSRRFQGQITDQLEAEFEDDPRAYTYCHTAWSINPERFEGKPTFGVFQGDKLRPPRVLEEDEETSPADRHLIVRVPEHFRRRFTSNIVKALQDVAGVSTQMVGGYFQDKEKLYAASCLPNILMCKADAIGNALDLLPPPHSFDLQNRTSPRAVHGDLSLSGDLTGLAIGHIAAYTDEGLPLILIDGLARLHPPKHGQIVLDSVYQLVAAWKAAGVPVEWVSFDGFQSADLIQRIRRLGIRTGRLSVDRTAPDDPCGAYESLRNAICEDRFKFPKDPETCRDMLALQMDQRRQKVDHIPGQKKDVSDALAGVCFHLTHQVYAWQMVDKVENAGFAAAIASPKLGGTVTGIPYCGFRSAMDEIRYRRGMPAR